MVRVCISAASWIGEGWKRNIHVWPSRDEEPNTWVWVLMSWMELPGPVLVFLLSVCCLKKKKSRQGESGALSYRDTLPWFLDSLYCIVKCTEAGDSQLEIRSTTPLTVIPSHCNTVAPHVFYLFTTPRCCTLTIILRCNAQLHNRLPLQWPSAPESRASHSLWHCLPFRL